MNNQPDILVLGLGPAGACAATACAKAGFNVMAIEKKAIAGAPVQCAEFVPAMIGSEVAALNETSIQAIRSMVTFVEDQPPDFMANFPGRMIDREGFDRELGEQAKAAGAELHYGLKAQNISDTGTLTLSNGNQILPRILIGADGPNSLAGNAIGSVISDYLETRQISVPLLQAFDNTDIFLSQHITGGYAWAFPKAGVVNIGLGVHPQARSHMKTLLDELHQKLIAEGRVGSQILGHTGGRIPASGMVKPWGVIGSTLCLLAGDAAGLTNPITGAGINSAVISGKLAGDAAVHYLSNDNNITAADNYQEDLEDLFGASLARAVAHRQRLATYWHQDNTPSPEQLRGGWIAYDQYWQNQNTISIKENPCPA
ncbi:NAD(P)/FAD-dependent oxidoreductase [Oceanicaulis sp. AH-315-P02]|nr:NAD(P)/FAD-dependent oxidoreductase [Robiginitomaculum sp.]MBN4047683.1 NAD(P)/FAD-dependent oxidoreductase [Oceanicaulis sp. AH-315-P02]